MEMHLEILDKKRRALLPLFKAFKDRFYLAGGTALAFQLAHRDSIDFDFFADKEFKSDELLREVRGVFAGRKIEVAQAGNMTLNIIIDGDIRASFFCIKDKLIRPLHESEYFRVADIDDIACMKMAALTRAELKDYVDLYYILQQKTLKSLIDDCQAKYEGFAVMVYLKALTSFEDIHRAKILFGKGKAVTVKRIERFLKNAVKTYLKLL